MAKQLGIVIDCADPAALGATELRRHPDPADYFIVLADPEGNEFCLV